jgi:hypothetical protein
MGAKRVRAFDNCNTAGVTYTSHMFRRAPLSFTLVAAGFIFGVCAAFFSIHPVFSVSAIPFDPSAYGEPSSEVVLSVIIDSIGSDVLIVDPVAPPAEGLPLRLSYDAETIFKRSDTDTQEALAPRDIAAKTPALVWVSRNPGKLHASQVIILGYL